ncbi:hypothetical protein [Flavobacterium sp.]|uniref:hypothetical protein n=1 Tax=Flavobacterium sp. TaxID=239 RepID=UPI00286D89D3|nr:hypothetical protein [Flavobacterium sp.]
MKLNYNIIWVDDKIDTRPYLAIKKDLFDFVTNEFFNCDIQEAEDFNEFQELFNEDKSYDLIITDLSLNNGTTGKEVIDFIRENKHNHTEIFFYSANTKLRQQQLINSNRITFYQLTEGNYNELKNEIIDLVKLTISKFQHIVSMRGMIMHETSSLDVKIEDILNQIINKGDKDKLLNIIKEKFLKTSEEFAKRISKCNDVEELLQFIGADHRVRAILRNISNVEVKNILSDYTKEVITVRNQFAHAELNIETNIFKTKNGLIFNDAQCVIIRKNINKHLKNLDALQSFI